MLSKNHYTMAIPIPPKQYADEDDFKDGHVFFQDFDKFMHEDFEFVVFLRNQFDIPDVFHDEEFSRVIDKIITK